MALWELLNSLDRQLRSGGRPLTLGALTCTLLSSETRQSRRRAMTAADLRTHEIAFCSRVAGWLNGLFEAHPEWPFRRAEIEDSQALHRKRSDLRVYGDARRLISRLLQQFQQTPICQKAFAGRPCSATDWS